MCEQLCPESLLEKNDIDCLIQRCLKAEQDQKLSVNFIKELKSLFKNSWALKRYLMEFGKYCKVKGISSPTQLTPDFLREYTENRCINTGPNLKKAVVWSLRKFGKFLNLIQVVSDDPAKNLRHPKFHPALSCRNILVKPSFESCSNTLKITKGKR